MEVVITVVFALLIFGALYFHSIWVEAGNRGSNDYEEEFNRDVSPVLRHVRCRECDGQGLIQDDIECFVCHGDGTVEVKA